MDIELAINGRFVDLNGVFSMPLTKQYEDLINPTAIKNSFSKTIQLPATPTNNAIFSNIWMIDQINHGNFDPSKRINFVLTTGGEFIIDGYIKLSKINYVGGEPRSYEINMYGGIGDFFYSLSEKDMQDLILPNNNLSQVITKEAVRNPVAGMKFFYSYQGQYENFESDQIYYPSSPEADANGYVKLDKAYDEHQINQYRSYYQRPAVLIGQLIDLLLLQSGRDVNLSSAFKDLPYYSNGYIGLQMPEKTGNTIKYLANIVGYDNLEASFLYPNYKIHTSNAVVNATNPVVLKNSNGDPNIFNASTGEITIPSGSNKTIDFEFKFQLLCRFTTPTDPGNDTYRMYTREGREPSINDKTFVLVQVYMPIGNVVLAAFTYEFENGTLQVSEIRRPDTDVMYSGLMFNNINGEFEFTLKGSYTAISGINKVVLRAGIHIAPDYRNMSATSAYVYGYNSSRLCELRLANYDFNVVSVLTSEDIRSGSTINYTTYMPAGISQMNFLLNYLKPFGIYWNKNDDGSISGFTRNEFFKDYKIIDWTNKIDYSKAKSIDPLSFSYRYAILKWQDSQTYRAQYYKQRIHIDYGSMQLDTGWEFDDSENDLIKESIFTDVAMAMEYDYTFNGRNSSFAGRDDKVMPAIYTLQNNVRTQSNEYGQLFFWEGLKSCNLYYLTDDNPVMANNGLFSWIATSADSAANAAYRMPLSIYPAMSRITTYNNKYYSWDFGKPSELYYPATDTDYPAEATIYNRFWRRYMEERLNSNTRIMTCYAYITLPEFRSWKFSNFIQIEDTIWHVNKIIDFDLTKNQSTKVELVRVNDITAYVNGQDY